VSGVFNIFGDAEWSDNDREGYRHRAAPFGKLIRAELMGATLYDVPPGERTWPYHWESMSEEWLLVVSGQPTLRTPDGEQELRPGDVVAFPAGPGGAHGLENREEEPARVVILSTKGPLDVVHYPDTGKVGIWTAERGYVAIMDEPDEPPDYWQVEER
jgi:uncharacterized cupin superfamily protein